MTVSGSAVVTNNGTINLGNRNNMTAMLNLNGGETTAKRIWRANRSNTDALINWNGGLLRAVNPDTAGLFNGRRSLSRCDRFENGAIVDIPTAGMMLSINTPLRRPTGLGVMSIPLPRRARDTSVRRSCGSQAVAVKARPRLRRWIGPAAQWRLSKLRRPARIIPVRRQSRWWVEEPRQPRPSGYRCWALRRREG